MSQPPEEAYKNYVKYCSTIDCPPAPYGAWLKMQHTPTAYPRADEPALLHTGRSLQFGVWSKDGDGNA